MDKVTKFRSANNADDILEQAIGKYKDVLILGWDKNEYLDARATAGLKAAEINWLLDVFKNKLIAGDYADEE